MRFRCLLKHRVLHYTPQVASQIITSCAVLHNICIKKKIPIINDDDLQDIDYGNIPLPQNNEPLGAGRINHDLAEGRRIRNNLIRRFFS